MRGNLLSSFRFMRREFRVLVNVEVECVRVWIDGINFFRSRSLREGNSRERCEKKELGTFHGALIIPVSFRCLQTAIAGRGFFVATNSGTGVCIFLLISSIPCLRFFYRVYNSA